jgi:methyl-CpG-binding domain protein 4
MSTSSPLGRAAEAPQLSPPPQGIGGAVRVVSPHFAAAAAAAAAAADSARSPSREHTPPVEAQHAALTALQAYVRSLGGGRLPRGWRVDVRTRGSGASAGHTDAYFVSPDGTRFRSRREVARALGLSGGGGGAAAAASSGKGLRKARRAVVLPPSDDTQQQQQQHTPSTLAGVAAAPPRVVSSPFFAPPAVTAAASPAPPRRRLPTSAADNAGARRDGTGWEPPPSPFGLIQETLFRDPWKVLVACLLLNKTTGDAVRRVIWELFQLIPTPEAALAAPLEAIVRIIRPLGLTKRAGYIQRLSQQYLHSDWRNVRELTGCGKYASDAYALFCSGAWRDVAPEDKELRKYHVFLVDTDGKGRGLSRDPPPKGIVIAGL